MNMPVKALKCQVDDLGGPRRKINMDTVYFIGGKDEHPSQGSETPG